MNAMLLKAKIIESGKSVQEVCAAAGFCKSAFYRKMRGKSEFTQREISVIQRLLGLDVEKTAQIFFA